ncbi:MAG: hypothetical protein KH543_14230 [Clostridiaceae bacterium]|nr:hypothetical protein [Clostridiaceae bacterium]
MVRYFKLIEIDRDNFVEATGEDLDFYSQLIVPVDGLVYGAVNDDDEEELDVPLHAFDTAVNGEED